MRPLQAAHARSGRRYRPGMRAVSSTGINTSRRRWLQSAAAVAGLTVTGGAARILARPQFLDDPFTLRVASGDPTTDGFVLWTRLAPDPLHGGGMQPFEMPVQWQIAADEAFGRIVQSGVAMASAEWAHSLHVEVNGLVPDRWYWYR